VYVLTSNFPTRKFAVVRYLDNGTTDAAFGSGGKVITAIGVENFARVVAIDSTDRIGRRRICVSPTRVRGVGPLPRRLPGLAAGRFVPDEPVAVLRR
jgi:hypothetical protein